MRVDYDVVEMVVVSVVLIGASAAWYSAGDPLVMKAAAGGIMRCVLSWHLLPLQTRYIDAECGQIYRNNAFSCCRHVALGWR